MQKGQSTLEYLVTYGWAILILVVVASILWYLGIFNPSRWIGRQSIGFSKFVINDFNVGTNGTLTVIFASKEDKTIQDVKVSVLNPDGSIRTGNGPGPMSPGTQYTLPITDAVDAGNVGDPYNIHIRITYRKVSLPHSDDGHIMGALEQT